jgi:hypothetical protein
LTLKYAMIGAASLLIASAGSVVAQDKPGGSSGRRETEESDMTNA